MSNAGSPLKEASAKGATPTARADPGEGLLGIGAAAARAGVTERSLRYYEQLGLIRPSGQTKGGSRRYSLADLDRVARIRELQSLLGLNLEEIARVLGNEDRSAEIRASFGEDVLTSKQRRQLLEESLAGPPAP
jgi:MerR family transcriptional regulator, repressor of the yfmOP operon